MQDVTFAKVLRGAVVAGLAAGLLAAAFHTALTESVIEQAIALEEQLKGAAEAADQAAVSRDAQRLGLVVGFLLYGLTWGLLVAVLYHSLRGWMPSLGGLRQGLLVTLVAYWALAAFPFLKYPANPPAVGDPETITYRQGLYLGLLALSGVAAAAAAALARSGRSRWPWAVALLALVDVALYVVMPANPDPVRIPDEVVSAFRALSLIGLTLFWGALGLIFGLLLRHEQRAANTPPHPERSGGLRHPSPQLEGN